MPPPALLPPPQAVCCAGLAGRLAPFAATTDAARIAAADTYELTIDASGTRLVAGGPEGLRYGIATHRQLQRQADATGVLPTGLVVRDRPTLPLRGLHIDLKFHAARFDWLLGWLEQLAAWKINLLVLEFEDKFPYRRFPELVDRKAWTREQVVEFRRKATALGIQTVPLLQCLGHFEYVLRLEKHAPLRERATDLSQLCPSNPQTLALVQGLAEEIIELFPDCGYFHIGADETGLLGECPTCATRAAALGGKVALYADYVGRHCQWVLDRGMRPLVWDDILRHDPARVAMLPKETVLVYWDYGMSATRVDPAKKGQYDGADLLTGAPRSVPGHPKPVYAAYREAGYDVLMAPCFTAGQLVPSPAAGAGNCRQMAAEAAVYGCLGVLSTSWSVLFTPFALAHHAVAATADAGWNPLPSREDMLTDRRPDVTTEFNRRFCREFLGLDSDTFVHALNLLCADVMYRPPGKLPTALTEPAFVDPDLLFPKGFGLHWVATFFRSEWDTPERGRTFDECWAAKIASIRANPALGKIIATVRDLLARCREGVRLLEGVAAQATRNSDYVHGVLTGARVRVWRLEVMLHQIADTPPPAPWPGARGELAAVYAASLHDDDARELAGWLLAGTP